MSLKTKKINLIVIKEKEDRKMTLMAGAGHVIYVENHTYPFRL